MVNLFLLDAGWSVLPIYSLTDDEMIVTDPRIELMSIILTLSRFEYAGLNHYETKYLKDVQTR